MKTTYEKVQQQVKLQAQIQNAGLNIVNCGSCGSVLLHDLEDEEIECTYCDFVSEPCDFPDFLYQGCEEFYKDETVKIV